MTQGQWFGKDKAGKRSPSPQMRRAVSWRGRVGTQPGSTWRFSSACVSRGASGQSVHI